MNKTEQETPFSEKNIKFRPHIVYIQGVSKLDRQTLAPDRLPSLKHILLRNPWAATLCFSARGTLQAGIKGNGSDIKGGREISSIPFNSRRGRLKGPKNLTYIQYGV